MKKSREYLVLFSGPDLLVQHTVIRARNKAQAAFRAGSNLSKADADKMVRVEVVRI